MIEENGFESVSNPSIIYTAFFLIVFLLLVSTNLLLILVFIRNPVLITPIQLFYINLCCSNIALALFSLTFGLVALLSSEWIFPDMVCHMVGFFNSTSVHLAMFTMFAITNERYHLRLSHKRHGEMYTLRKISLSIGVYWGVSILLSSLPFIPSLGHYDFHPNLGTCWTPRTILGALPAVTNSIYLVLWVFVTFNLLTLPRVALPDSLKAARSTKHTSILPQIVTSSMYSVGAACAVLYTILQRLGVVSGAVDAASERAALLLIYISLILIPATVMALNPELRLAVREVFKKGGHSSAESSKYEQIDAQHSSSPQFSTSCSSEYTAANNKKHVTIVPVRSQPGYPRPVYNPGPQLPYPPSTINNGVNRGPDPRCVSSLQRDPGLHRSHSSVGAYTQRTLPPRAMGTIRTPQRSHSLNRVNSENHQSIEMYALGKNSERETHGSYSKSDSEPSSSGIIPEEKAAVRTPKTTTSSVTSSTTVAGIVEP